MLKEMFDLSGKTACITGSARGIGRAIAVGLAEYGARVVVHGSKPSQPLEEAVAAVQKIVPSSLGVTGDLSTMAGVDSIFDQTARAGVAGIDILFANASIQKNVAWHEITTEDMLEQMQVNFNATLRLFQCAYPYMKTQGWGRLIAVGSVQEARPHPLMAVYAASKGAQENLVRNLAHQLASEGITVNNLCPGVFATDRNAAALANPEYAERIRGAIPCHDYALPQDAAGAALLLASNAGRYITGTTILIDGGLGLPG